MSTPASPACRNCGEAASGKYCPGCGQETATHPPAAWEFLHEFVTHYVALEGALWRTLGKLVRPGALTNEYYAGRRRQYVLPLRVYLTASLVFFLALKVMGPQPPLKVSFGLPGGSAAAMSAPAMPCKLAIGACATVNQRIEQRYGKLTRGQWGDILGERMVRVMPYAMFFLLPLFALLTRAAFWNRPRNYAEHLVFALHLHAWAFLLGALVSPFGNAYLLSIPASVYLGLALGRVFGGRQWVLMARYIAVLVAYGVLIIATILGILVVTALF